MDKRSLTEAEIRTQFITPAIQQAQWRPHQIREELALTPGRFRVRGRHCSRAKGRRADYVLYHKPNIRRIIESVQSVSGKANGRTLS